MQKVILKKKNTGETPAKDKGAAATNNAAAL